MTSTKKSPYGQIGREVAKLLTADRKKPLTYAQVAERIKAKRPEANTTARSVASVASSLRAAGANIPDHRASRSN